MNSQDYTLLVVLGSIVLVAMLCAFGYIIFQLHKSEKIRKAKLKTPIVKATLVVEILACKLLICLK